MVAAPVNFQAIKSCTGHEDLRLSPFNLCDNEVDLKHAQFFSPALTKELILIFVLTFN
jgi:hypothetical protein